MNNLAENINKDVSIFFTDCAINTISHLFNLQYLGIKNLFLGNCCPNVISPVLLEGLKNLFDIKEISSPKEDINLIFN